MPFTRTYNWGESLRLEAAMADGGLKAATDRIALTMGRASPGREDAPATSGGGIRTVRFARRQAYNRQPR